MTEQREPEELFETPPPVSEGDYGAEPPESEATFDLQESEPPAPRRPVPFEEWGEPVEPATVDGIPVNGSPVDIGEWTRPAASTAAGSRYYHISELAAQPPPNFLVDGLYVEKTFNLHYGPPKSGKTHLTTQIFYDLALGTPHFGRSVRKTGTLILAGEGENAIGLRARAFAKHHGADLHDMDIGIWADPIDLLAEDQTATVDSILRHYEKLKDPGNIAIDPWGKFMRGGDENSSIDMGRAIETARLLMERSGCTLFGVHHTPASTTQRPRGHTSLLADVELAAGIVKTGSTRTMTVNDARFIPEGEVLTFGLKVVQLDDCDLSACIVVPESELQQDTRKPRSRNEDLAWKALVFIYNTAGEDGLLEEAKPPKSPVQKAVQLPLVQDEFVRRYGRDRTTTLHAINTRWGEARKGLERKGYCGVHNEFVWPVFS